MSIGFVKRATFVCPAVTTGGPEAIHQAAQVFRSTGLPTDIAYTGSGAQFDFRDGRMYCSPPGENPCLEAYAHYEPIVCRQALLRRHHLIVLPEVMAPHVEAFGRATVAIWWLSVDNAQHLLDDNLRARLFGGSVRHLHQSAYAAEFLKRAGVRSAPLGDFLDPSHHACGENGPACGPGVSYNPAKGAERATEFFMRAPDLSPVPLRGMSPSRIADVLRGTSVYIDFGHFPGKDRMPREAALAGAVVFIHAAGAARFQEDFPVSDFYRFTAADVVSGQLARRVREVQSAVVDHWAAQAPFRSAIRGERAVLEVDVARLRGLQTVN